MTPQISMTKTALVKGKINLGLEILMGTEIYFKGDQSKPKVLRGLQCIIILGHYDHNISFHKNPPPQCH